MQQPTRPPAQPPATVPIGNARIKRFITENPHLTTPYLVLDLDVVRERYRALCAAVPDTGVYYAVKANPDPEVVGLLADLGSRFDVASLGEIDLCVGLGVDRLPRRGVEASSLGEGALRVDERVPRPRHRRSLDSRRSLSTRPPVCSAGQ